MYDRDNLAACQLHLYDMISMWPPIAGFDYLFMFCLFTASDFAARFSDKDFSKLPSFAKTIQNTPAVCEIMLLIRT